MDIVDKEFSGYREVPNLTLTILTQIIKSISFLFLETTPTGEGFKGCLFRAQFVNIYPFKRVFQDPRPPSIELKPAGDSTEVISFFCYKSYLIY